VKYININGRIEDAINTIIPYDNGAFRYGYGLFETILFKDGRIELKELHWNRLFSGLDTLLFDVPKLMTKEYLEEQIILTVKTNKLEKLCRVRLQVYAHNSALFDAARNNLEFIIECFELTDALININENGLILGIANGLQKSMDSLCNLKTSNSLIYAMAAKQAKANKWDDALIYNTVGNIIESSIANVFWVKEQIIYTPPLASGCVAGTMRSFIITALRSSNIIVKDEDISLDNLLSADEIFLTNAIRRVKWVYSIENKGFYKNNYTHHINKLLFYNK